MSTSACAPCSLRNAISARPAATSFGRSVDPRRNASLAGDEAAKRHPIELEDLR